MPEVYILEATRTARGKRKGGGLNHVHPVDLLAQLIDKTLDRGKVPPGQVDDLLIGCVTQVREQGANVGRAAALVSKLPDHVPGLSLNRYCGSALQTINQGAQAILSGMQDLVLAGGVECMSRVPLLADEPVMSPGIRALFPPEFNNQGIAAEKIVKKWGYSREQVDAFALRSQQLACRARKNGKFKRGIIPMDVPANGGPAFVFEEDEHPRPETTMEGLANLNPVFDPEGVITAGNASGIVDGASIVVLASGKKADELGCRPRAKILSMAVVGSDPVLMLTGPIPASRKALARAGLQASDVDLWEINEAFAPIPMITMQELGIEESTVNVNGGAIALGHPVGATGAMLVGTVLDELEARGLRFGLVTLCIGMGMGIATIIDRNV